jgi:FKBP-type peptidyl-prolyl cis-trans isomerase FkpA
VAYVLFGPQDAAAAAKYPGDPIVGEPIKTPTGVTYYELKEGTGRVIPSDTSKVRVKHEGYLKNGHRFDGPDTGEFGLDGVVKGWPDGMKGMKVGGKRKLIIPPDRGYANHPRPGSGIPPGATLIFDVELLEIVQDAAEPMPPGMPGIQ